MTEQKTVAPAPDEEVATVAPTDTKRRNFMIGASLGGVGAAAALVSGVAIKPKAESAPEPVVSDQGYRETEHVRRYYSTTRL